MADGDGTVDMYRFQGMKDLFAAQKQMQGYTDVVRWWRSPISLNLLSAKCIGKFFTVLHTPSAVLAEIVWSLLHLFVGMDYETRRSDQ